MFVNGWRSGDTVNPHAVFAWMQILSNSSQNERYFGAWKYISTGVLFYWQYCLGGWFVSSTVNPSANSTKISPCLPMLENQRVRFRENVPRMLGNPKKTCKTFILLIFESKRSLKHRNSSIGTPLPSHCSPHRTQPHKPFLANINFLATKDLGNGGVW